MLSFAFSLLLVLISKKGQPRLVACLFVPSLFLYGVAYELRKADFVEGYFLYNRVGDYDYYLFAGALFFMSAIIAFALLPRLSYSYRVSGSVILEPKVDFDQLRMMYYILSVISIAAFFVNFSRVNYSVSMLFVAPRIYEEQFGSSVIANYLYFLNVPALCLGIYCSRFDTAPRLSIPIGVTLVAISLFHGIKFTVFDTILFPALFYFHVSRSRRKAALSALLALLVVASFYLVFAAFVRGGGGSDLITTFLNYMLPNYYNFAHAISRVPFQFDPLGVLLPDKVPDPFDDIQPTIPYGFVLNDKYNMATAFTAYYGFASALSALFMLPIICYLRALVWRSAIISRSLGHNFILSYIDFCLFFSFYFFAFNKTKYVYYCFVMMAIGWLCSFRGKDRPVRRDA
jgi:hypothetical protein